MLVISGLPAYHPYVVQQGWDADMVDSSIKNDTKNMIEGGYNVAGKGPVI
jgi:hypothetical protein